jgi:hypothetical protein
VTPKEWKLLRKIEKSKQEPALFRCEALNIRALIKCSGLEFEDAAMYFRRALHVMPQQSVPEVNQVVTYDVSDTGQTLPAVDALQALKKKLKKKI